MARPPLDLGTCTVDIAGRTIRHAAGRSEKLTEHEARFLGALALHSPAEVPEAVLKKDVWGVSAMSSSTIARTVNRVRKKIEVDATDPRILLTCRGRGYRLVLGVQPDRPRSPAGASSNLVASLDRFIGRREEARRITTWLGAGDRAIAVVGAGGVGKSRLVREVLRGHERAGGTWCIDCSLLESIDEVLLELGRVLGAPVASDDANGWRAALATRPDLCVVWDGVELVRAELLPLLEDWLAQTPSATFIVTSRAPIDAPTWRVLSVAALPPSDAVELLVDRARGPALRTDDPAVLRLAERLDCLPLAIELVAHRLDVRDLAEVAESVEAALDLVGGPRADARHATIRITLSWSWALLDPTARSVAAAWALFRTPFTTDDAAAVGGIDLERSEEVTRSLLSHGFVVRSGNTLVLPPLVRRFVAETTDPSAAASAASAFVAHLGRPAHVALLDATRGPEAVKAWDALEAQMPNLLEAADCALQLAAAGAPSRSGGGTLGIQPQLAAAGAPSRSGGGTLDVPSQLGQANAAARVVELLGEVALARGAVSVAVPYVERTLAVLETSHDRTRLQWIQVRLAWALRRPLRSMVDALRADALAAGDSEHAALVAVLFADSPQAAWSEANHAWPTPWLHHVAVAHVAQAAADIDQELAREAAFEALDLARRLGSPALRANAELAFVHVLLAEGDFDQALAVVAHAVEGFQETGIVRNELHARMLLAHTHRVRGELEAARMQAEGIIHQAERIGHAGFASDARLLWAEILLELGTVSRALELVEQLEPWYRALPAPFVTASFLRVAASTLDAAGHHARAAQTWAEWERLELKAPSRVLGWISRARFAPETERDRWIEQAREKLDQVGLPPGSWLHARFESMQRAVQER